ncbi:MAG: phosphatidylglycerophosphate synthase [Deltaproteobacteria bacterium]|jgi:hypothetical protein|nr:phosphatidylglycerophosphate synthase [Deltaproteobacteria bacterium]
MGSTGIWVTPPPSAARVFGLRPIDRLRRALPGCAPVVESPTAPPPHLARRWLVVRGDAVLDGRLLEALLAARDVVLLGRPEQGAIPLAARVRGEALEDAGHWVRDGKPAPPGPVAPAGPDDLVHPYDAALRKRQPALLAALTPENSRDVEWELFQASYKGVTDWVTRTVWPVPAFHVVRTCAGLGVQPNAVTLLSWLLVLGATAAFAGGLLGAGLAMAWAMTFLDTVDGKLARVTLTSSRVGHVLDHGLDLVHPPFWWWAFGVGLGAFGAAADPILGPATWACVAGYGVGRLLEGFFLAGFGFEIHSYRPIDSVFRQFTARRNPNLVLLSAGLLAGRPDLGLVAVAGWTLFSILFHAGRLAVAGLRRARGTPVTPWEEEVSVS